jgi:hypothetical protein
LSVLRFISKQTVEEGEESVTGFVATRRSIRRDCFGKCFLLHGKCRFEINQCGFNMFVTEPQCGSLDILDIRVMS